MTYFQNKEFGMDGYDKAEKINIRWSFIITKPLVFNTVVSVLRNYNSFTASIFEILVVFFILYAFDFHHKSYANKDNLSTTYKEIS